MAGGDLIRLRLLAFCSLLLTWGAGCSPSNPSVSARLHAERIAHRALLEDSQLARGEQGELSASARALLGRRAGDAAELTLARFDEVGPSLWQATFSFDRLPVRNAQTGRPLPASGSLTLLVRARPRHDPLTLQISAETDVLLTIDPFAREIP